MNIPFEKIAENVLGFSVVVSTDSAEIVEKASFVSLGEVGYEALLREVFSYHLNLAIANVMITRNLFGKANYARIQDGIFEALSHILTTTGEPLGNNKELFAPNNKDIAQMYFCKDVQGWRVSEAALIWYADSYENQCFGHPSRSSRDCVSFNSYSAHCNKWQGYRQIHRSLCFHSCN